MTTVESGHDDNDGGCWGVEKLLLTRYQDEFEGDEDEEGEEDDWQRRRGEGKEL